MIPAAADLHFADAMAPASQGEGMHYLQPGWDSPEGQQLAIDHVRHNPTWRLSLQTHKWLGVR